MPHRFLAVAVAGAGAAVLAAAVSSAGAASTLPRLLSCSGSPLLRPAGAVVLSCADANSELKDTHWSAWSAHGASGTTDFGVNLCMPDCAASRIRFFPNSAVRLEKPISTSKGLLFSRVVVTYTLSGARKTFTAYPET